MSAVASAWALACTLFTRKSHTWTAVLSDHEQDVLERLSGMQLVQKCRTDSQYVLCPYCQLNSGQVIRQGAELYCQCNECGEVSVDPASFGAWQIDVDRLIWQLRLALDIPAQQQVAEITDGIWRIGNDREKTVILARSIEEVLLHPLEIRRAGNKAQIITPKPTRKSGIALGEPLIWLPMDECFHIYGGQIRFVAPGTLAADDAVNEEAAPVCGPFSANFRWVHLASWPHGVICLSKAQSAIFRALWDFKGRPETAERVMLRAGYQSDKPADLFKVKSQNKGNPRYEGQHHAYEKLVQVDQREGLYSMSCAAR